MHFGYIYRYSSGSSIYVPAKTECIHGIDSVFISDSMCRQNQFQGENIHIVFVPM